MTIDRVDAYRYLKGFQYGKVVEAQSFIDALVYPCKKPRAAATCKVIHFERPAVPNDTT